MTFADYTEFRRSTDMASTYNMPPGVYASLGLAGETGEAIDKIKKLHRDWSGEATPEWTIELKKELGDVLWYLDRIATDFGLTLEDVALTNVAKLRDRMHRGVLSGNGDNR